MAKRKQHHLHETVVVDPGELRPHPANYKEHPADQIEHIKASIKQFGFYRNVVVSSDGFILAGHGVIKAALEMKLTEAPVIRVALKHNDPRALKILAGDNEITNLAEVDDRQLSEILKTIMDSNEGLEGTGYDAEKLAALVLITRPASEIPDVNTAAHWVGVPGYENKEDPYKLIIAFDSEADRDKFMTEHKVQPQHVLQKLARATTIAWPLRERVKKHEKIVVGE